MTTTLPAAVLWDMDGTLVDTEPFWIESETQLVASYGGTWTHEDALTVVGSGLWATAALLQDRGVDLHVDKIVSTLTGMVIDRIEKEGAPFRPGARELLRELRDAGVPTALVTMSIRPMAERIIAAIGFEAFDAVVTGDEVSQSKPHPEPYLRAAELLDVDIARCIAFEDSAPGIASAAAAGTIAVVIPHAVAVPPSDDYIDWPTLSGKTLADLSALMRTAPHINQEISS